MFSKWSTSDKVVGIILAILMLAGGIVVATNAIREHAAERSAEATRAAWTPTPVWLKRETVEEVCQGRGNEMFAVYDPDADREHPTAYFAAHDLDLGQEHPTAYSEESGPGDRAFGENHYRDFPYHKAELVVCIVPVDESFFRSCRYTDGTLRATVHYYDATWQVSIYAARTGEQLATTRIAAEWDACPTRIWGGGGKRLARLPRDQMERFVSPYVNPDD